MAQYYLRKAVSNGRPREQALIRRWWYEKHAAQGRIVWEYFLERKYADASWFAGFEGTQVEENGLKAPERFPLAGQEVVLCEAKPNLTHEVVGHDRKASG